MYEKLSKSAQIIARLEREGKIIKLNKSDHLKKIEEMNDYMAEVRRDYRIKAVLSEISASKVTFTD